jgi:hypothetical protein
VWKKSTPFLYDLVIGYALQWPSLIHTHLLRGSASALELSADDKIPKVVSIFIYRIFDKFTK